MGMHKKFKYTKVDKRLSDRIHRTHSLWMFLFCFSLFVPLFPCFISLSFIFFSDSFRSLPISLFSISIGLRVLPFPSVFLLSSSPLRPRAKSHREDPDKKSRATRQKGNEGELGAERRQCSPHTVNGGNDL